MAGALKASSIILIIGSLVVLVSTWGIMPGPLFALVALFSSVVSLMITMNRLPVMREKYCGPQSKLYSLNYMVGSLLFILLTVIMQVAGVLNPDNIYWGLPILLVMIILEIFISDRISLQTQP